jgi:hypothetical protein
VHTIHSQTSSQDQYSANTCLLTKLIPLDESALPTTGDVISSVHSDEIIHSSNKRRTIFFICEPIIAGLFIFPLLIMFWQSGWNFMVGWLDTPLSQRRATLLSMYVLSQFLFLFIYLHQDRLYFLLVKQESKFYSFIILQFHSLFTAFNYIIQWVTMWTLWDWYTSDDWLIMLLISIIAILTVIILTGHPCDLVCAPFVISYDSTEYNVRIGTPFVTEKVIYLLDSFLNIKLIKMIFFQMNQILSHILNYIFYEHIISLLTILAWRGSYALLDIYLYPDDANLSAGICLIIGYPSYFILMYTQSFQNGLCLIPKFLDANFPLFIQNIRHLCAFVSCVLLWRGFWILYDAHIATIPFAQASPYAFYTICMLTSFIILSLMKTGSSINGPMSHMHDEYNLFPLYPNCFLVKWFNSMKTSDEVPSNASETTNIDPFTITVF